MIDSLLVILQVVASHGFLGVLVVALLEKLIPIIPAMLLYGMIGASAVEGTTPVVMLVLATALGSCAGSAVWYVGMRRATSQFRQVMMNRFGGPVAVFFNGIASAGGTVCGAALAQVLPGVRFGIALFAVDGRSSLLRFAIGTFLGAMAWSTIFLGIGAYFGGFIFR